MTHCVYAPFGERTTHVGLIFTDPSYRLLDK